MSGAIYIAGPMRGYPNFNFPAFNAAADYWSRVCGFDVFNPAQDDMEKYGCDISEGNNNGCEKQAEQEHGFSLRDALARDCDWLCRDATHIYMLKGWEQSKGATAEWALANALGLEVYYQQ